jgi:hypothetical protein
MKTLKFEKENGTWYIVLKLWPGPKSALAMVSGADKMLDKLSKDKVSATINVSEQPIEGAIKASLIVPNKLLNGGDYTIETPKDYPIKRLPKKMWLCNVTRYVYLGRMPKVLYIVNS